MSHASRLSSLLVLAALSACLSAGCTAPSCPPGLGLDTEGRCALALNDAAGSDAGVPLFPSDGSVGTDAAIDLADAGMIVEADAAPDPDACLTATYYADVDGDGHGDLASPMDACTAPEGFVLSSDDCDDDCATCFPGATEICDGLDQNCDGSSDTELYVTFYADADGDGYGAGPAIAGCAVTDGHSAEGGDCNDSLASIHPHAAEICDGVDQNCDGHTDEGVATDYFPDCDGDGYIAADAVATPACARPIGVPAICGASDGAPAWATRTPGALADCFDASRYAYPGATGYHGLPYSYRGVSSHDYDCDGAQERRVNVAGTSDATCTWRTVPGAPRVCVATGERWTTNPLRACGTPADLRTCDAVTCTPTVVYSTLVDCR